MNQCLLRGLRLPVVVLIAASLLSPLGGCGDSGSGGGGGADVAGGDAGGSGGGGADTQDSPGPADSLGGFGNLTLAGDLAAAICDWMVGCCTVNELELVIGQLGSSATTALEQGLAEAIWEDPASCSATVRSLVIDVLRPLDAAITAGRAQLDAGAISACLAHYASGGCAARINGQLVDDHPCSASSLATGTVFTGGLCRGDFECAGAGHCDWLGGFGVCKAPAPLDGPCTDDAGCAGEAHCSGSGYACVPRQLDLAPWCDSDLDCPAGQLCAESVDQCVDALDLGSVCQSDRQCASSFCALATSQTCEEPLSTGALCVRDSACGASGYCDQDGPTVRRCVARTVLGIDQLCGDGAGVCDDHLVCAYNGVCAPRVEMGEACIDSSYCPAAGWCRYGWCIPRAPIGGECSDDAECVAIGWCDGGVCAGRIGLGLPCELGDACVAGASCDVQFGVVGTCVALPDLGSDCPAGACGLGLACVEFPGTCAVRSALGESCQHDGTCAADLRCEAPLGAEQICQPPRVVGLGEYCLNAEVVCAPDLKCLVGTCEAAGLVGTPCASDDECLEGSSCIQGLCANRSGAYGPCDSAPDCSSSLFCDVGVSQCTPQKTVDQPCQATEQCLASLYCDPDTATCSWEKALNELCGPALPCKEGLFCANNGLCAARVSAGFPCDVGVFEMCLDPLSCVDSICATPPGPGLPCHPQLGCAEGARCEATSNLCVATLPAGAPCSATAECGGDLYCGEIGPSCVARAPDGSSCGPTLDDCLPGSSCQSAGHCRPRIEVGGICTGYETSCVSGATCDDAGLCVAALSDAPLGSPCSSWAECASGRCQAGVCVGLCEGL